MSGVPRRSEIVDFASQFKSQSNSLKMYAQHALDSLTTVDLDEALLLFKRLQGTEVTGIKEGADINKFMNGCLVRPRGDLDIMRVQAPIWTQEGRIAVSEGRIPTIHEIEDTHLTQEEYEQVRSMPPDPKTGGKVFGFASSPTERWNTGDGKIFMAGGLRAEIDVLREMAEPDIVGIVILTLQSVFYHILCTSATCNEAATCSTILKAFVSGKPVSPLPVEKPHFEYGLHFTGPGVLWKGRGLWDQLEKDSEMAKTSITKDSRSKDVASDASLRRRRGGTHVRESDPPVIWGAKGCSLTPSARTTCDPKRLFLPISMARDYNNSLWLAEQHGLTRGYGEGSLLELYEELLISVWSSGSMKAKKQAKKLTAFVDTLSGYAAPGLDGTLGDLNVSSVHIKCFDGKLTINDEIVEQNRVIVSSSVRDMQQEVLSSYPNWRDENLEIRAEAFALYPKHVLFLERCCEEGRHGSFQLFGIERGQLFGHDGGDQKGILYAMPLPRELPGDFDHVAFTRMMNDRSSGAATAFLDTCVRGAQLDMVAQARIVAQNIAERDADQHRVAGRNLKSLANSKSAGGAKTKFRFGRVSANEMRLLGESFRDFVSSSKSVNILTQGRTMEMVSEIMGAIDPTRPYSTGERRVPDRLIRLIMAVALQLQIGLVEIYEGMSQLFKEGYNANGKHMDPTSFPTAVAASSTLDRVSLVLAESGFVESVTNMYTLMTTDFKAQDQHSFRTIAITIGALLERRSGAGEWEGFDRLEVIAASLASSCYGYYASKSHASGDNIGIDIRGEVCPVEGTMPLIQSFGNGSGIKPTERFNSLTSSITLSYPEIQNTLCNGDDTVSRVLKEQLIVALKTASVRGEDLGQILKPEQCGAGEGVSFLRNKSCGYMLLQRALPLDAERPSVYVVNPSNCKDIVSKAYEASSRYGSDRGFHRIKRGMLHVYRRFAGVGRHLFEDLGYGVAGGSGPSLWGVLPITGCSQALRAHWNLVEASLGRGITPQTIKGFRDGSIKSFINHLFGVGVPPDEWVPPKDVKLTFGLGASQQGEIPTLKSTMEGDALRNLQGNGRLFLDEDRLALSRAVIPTLNLEIPDHQMLYKYAYEFSSLRQAAGIFTEEVVMHEGSRSIAQAAHDAPHLLETTTRSFPERIGGNVLKVEEVGRFTYVEEDFYFNMTIRMGRTVKRISGETGPIFSETILTRIASNFFGYDSHAFRAPALFPTDVPDMTAQDYKRVIRAMRKNNFSGDQMAALLGLRAGSVFNRDLADLEAIGDIDDELGFVTTGMMQNIDLYGPVMRGLAGSCPPNIPDTHFLRYIISYHVTVWSLKINEFYDSGRSYVARTYKDRLELPLYRIALVPDY